MKLKTKHLVCITIILMISFIITLTNFSNAILKFEVSNVNVTLVETKAEVKWDETSQADGYEIYLELPTIGYQNLGTIHNNKVNIIGFKEGEIYAIKIRAYKNENNTKIYSDFSSEIRFKVGDGVTTTELGKVTNVKAVSLGYSATLSWDKVANAQGYEIYACLANGEYIEVGTTESTEVRLIGVRPNIVYNIKIRAFLETNGTKIYGTFSEPAVLKYNNNNEKPDKVKNLRVTMNEDSAKLTWNELDNVDGYEIAIEIPSKGDAIYYSDSNSKVLTGFSSNYTYKVKVRAYNYINGEKVYGDYSDYASIRYEKEVDKVENLRVETFVDKATFRWDRVNGADGYELVVNIPGYGDCKYDVNSNKKILTGFTNTKYDYTVKVRAYEYINGYKVYGEYSNVEYFRNTGNIEVDRVTGVNVEVVGSKAKVKWNEVSGADRYEIILYIPGRGEYEYSTADTDKSITGIKEIDGEYYVKVRAYKSINGEKYYGDYSNKVYFRKDDNIDEEIERVTGLTVIRNGESATFRWDRVSEADGYELVVNIPGIGDCKYNEQYNSRYMTGFTQTKYKYTVKVRAYKYKNGIKIYGDYSTIKSF